jgi:UDP-N-acetylglucosamine 1-carboxyvinyltransferase
MEALTINGSQKLNGEVEINGAKNSILPLMVCSLLTDDDMNLFNVPVLTDVLLMTDLLKNYGANVLFDQSSRAININCKSIKNFEAPSTIVNKMRASIWALAPMLARFAYAKISLPGGDPIGDKKSGVRQIDLHLTLLEQMGASIRFEGEYIIAKSNGKLKATNFYFNKISVGATINAILASVLAEGETALTNCAIEPEITDMCRCLLKMGAKISGIGTRALKIIGVDKLSGSDHHVIPDRIEAGTYLMMAAITGGQVRVNNINQNLLGTLCQHLEASGSKLVYFENSILLNGGDKILPVDIQTEPFPGFVTDLQAQFISLMCLSTGTSRITENIYDNRFMHVAELNKMGANISIQNNTAVVTGVPKLYGNSVYASDIRASVCLVMAGLVAEGATKINHAHHLVRGYEDLVGKLAGCGVTVVPIAKDEILIVA